MQLLPLAAPGQRQPQLRARAAEPAVALPQLGLVRLEIGHELRLARPQGVGEDGHEPTHKRRPSAPPEGGDCNQKRLSSLEPTPIFR